MKRGGSYIEPPEWIKKKATINFKNEDNKCFQYSTLVGLYYDEIENNHQRLTKVNKFVDRCDWSGINFQAGINDWKRFELNNKSVVLNILYVPYGEKIITPAYKSKYNSERDFINDK